MTREEYKKSIIDILNSDSISDSLMKELYLLVSNPREFQFFDIYDKVPIDVSLYNELANELPEMFI